MTDLTTISKINEVIDRYFITHPEDKKVKAKDLMPYFIQAGIFASDHRAGLPIRRILRSLREAKQLHLIPPVREEKKQVNSNWYFVNTRNFKKQFTIPEIHHIFLSEFAPVSDKFNILELRISVAKNAQEKEVWKPGVYVFYANNRVIKVGRHLSNSRKRAFEHINDGTKNDQFNMSIDFDKEKDKLILFNLKEEKDAHWAAAVEIYLEKVLEPVIHSKRTG